jgi:hypothetical protein
MAIQEDKTGPAFSLPDQNGNKVAKAADHLQDVLEAGLPAVKKKPCR